MLVLLPIRYLPIKSLVERARDWLSHFVVDEDVELA